MDNDKYISTVENTIEIRYCFDDENLHSMDAEIFNECEKQFNVSNCGDDENGFINIIHKKKSNSTTNIQQHSLFSNFD
jgi:hypothetical protein